MYWQTTFSLSHISLHCTSVWPQNDHSPGMHQHIPGVVTCIIHMSTCTFSVSIFLSCWMWHHQYPTICRLKWQPDVTKVNFMVRYCFIGNSLHHLIWDNQQEKDDFIHILEHLVWMNRWNYESCRQKACTSCSCTVTTKHSQWQTTLRQKNQQRLVQQTRFYRRIQIH